MGRGRTPLPPELKRLRGNPGNRTKAQLAHDLTVIENIVPMPRKAQLEIPDFLTEERERYIFKLIIDDYLQRRVARAPDFYAFGRWAHYMHRWISCKEKLGNKETWIQYETAAGKQIRRHPLFRDMLDIERVLQSEEDRLGLNPVARHNILRGLTAMPAALGGDIFSEDKPENPIIDASKISPLGFLDLKADDEPA